MGCRLHLLGVGVKPRSCSRLLMAFLSFANRQKTFIKSSGGVCGHGVNDIKSSKRSIYWTLSKVKLPSFHSHSDNVFMDQMLRMHHTLLNVTRHIDTKMLACWCRDSCTLLRRQYRADLQARRVSRMLRTVSLYICYLLHATPCTILSLLCSIQHPHASLT